MFTKISRVFFLVAAGVVSFPAFISAEGLERVQFNLAKSSVHWVGRKVTGSHNGTVGISSGEAVLADGALKTGKFQIDIGKVVVEDIEDAEYNAKLTKHLKSEDFFSVEKFPLVDFTIKEATKLDKVGPKGENTKIKGELSIKGLSHPVEFPAKVTIANGEAEATGTVALDRTKWDIRYGSGKFFQGLGDKLIYDEFEVTFVVKGSVVH